MAIKHFEIWREGWLATGLEGNPERAQKEGEADGETFIDACNAFAEENPAFAEHFSIRGGEPYSWICRLFDNEADARRSCG